MNSFRRIFSLYHTTWAASFWLLGVLCILFLFVEIHNGRFHYHDFKVYYTAAQRILAGENLYRPVEDGFYRYLYMPTAAFYFLPFSLLPFPIAKVSYWLFLTVMILAGFYLSLSLVLPDFQCESPQRINTIVLLAALILGVHIQRELHLGQVNHLLLVMYLWMAYGFAKRKPVALAFIWAASLFIKPFGLIFAPYCIIKKRFKELGWLAIFAAILFLSPLLFYDTAEFITQLQGAKAEIDIELAEKQDMLQPGNHTIFSVIARYAPLRLINFTPTVTRAYQLSVLLGMALFVLWLMRRGKSILQAEVLEWAILLGYIPLIAFTSYNAFGFIELIVFLVIVNFRRLTVCGKGCAIAGFILTGGNWHDLWGKTLWRVFEKASCLTLGTILLMIVLAMYRRDRKL